MERAKGAVVDGAGAGVVVGGGWKGDQGVTARAGQRKTVPSTRQEAGGQDWVGVPEQLPGKGLSTFLSKQRIAVGGANPRGQLQPKKL